MAQYRTGVYKFWNWGGGKSFESPSAIEGDIGVTVHLQMDGRIAIGTPTWDGVPMTVARNQSGGGQAWTGSCKICYIKNPPTGVKIVGISGTNGASMFIYLLSGVEQFGDPVADVDGRYGFGTPTVHCSVDVSAGVGVAVGGCHSSNTGCFLTGSNEGTSRASRSPVWDSARSYRFQSSDGALGPEIYHHYDWSGQYADSVAASVAFKGQEFSGGQTIWCMSKIYDRIQENCRKLGIGDLGGFKRDRNGLWKPQSGLVTI